MYVAKKPCNFAGKRYVIGETIPDELVDTNRAGTLLKFGLIEKVEEKQPEAGNEEPKGENKPAAVPDGANKPVNAEDGEKPQDKPEDGKKDVKNPLNATRKPANKAANAKAKQKGGK